MLDGVGSTNVSDGVDVCKLGWHFGSTEHFAASGTPGTAIKLNGG